MSFFDSLHDSIFPGLFGFSVSQCFVDFLFLLEVVLEEFDVVSVLFYGLYGTLDDTLHLNKVTTILVLYS